MAEKETIEKIPVAEGADIYEIGFDLVPTLTEAEAAVFLSGLKDALTKRGVTLIADEIPKRITLAYTMTWPQGGKQEKFKEAHFGWVKFECQKSEMKEIEEALKRDKRILRHLLITTVRESSGGSRRLFTSDRLAGETIKKRQVAERKGGVMTEAELDKTIEELVAEPAKTS